MVVQRDELEVTLTAGAAKLGPRDAALVGLCRLLADRIDAAGADVSTHLTASYLSALKDLGRVLGESKTEAAGGNLARLRSVKTSKPAVKSTTKRRSA